MIDSIYLGSLLVSSANDAAGHRKGPKTYSLKKNKKTKTNLQ